MSDAVVTHRLTRYYSGRPVVDSLNLRIPRGTVYGLLGRNGAGKSTTIKMLMGLVHPDFGRAALLGEDSRRLSPALLARVAYIAEGHPLYRWMTVDQILSFSRAFYRSWNDLLVEEILAHFQLPRKQRIRHLSRGQRAQVALALAAAPDPELLILDDPTMGLDTVVRRDFLESMIQIIQRQGRTILFSSHILADVERVADRIGVLVDGVLRVDCPTEVFKQTVRKVVLEFGTRPPDFPPLAGLIGCRRLGTRLELITVRVEELQEHVDRLAPLSQEVVELNLDDAFIEYTRGPRRSIPTFSREPDNVESVSV
jgi:ABC-2 type transport system ATP-binding protein